MVNGRPVLTGDSVVLHNNAVVEFASLRFIFLINADLINAIRLESTKSLTVAAAAAGRN
jgi:microspherule protein 1